MEYIYKCIMLFQKFWVIEAFYNRPFFELIKKQFLTDTKYIN